MHPFMMTPGLDVFLLECRSMEPSAGSLGEDGGVHWLFRSRGFSQRLEAYDAATERYPQQKQRHSIRIDFSSRIRYSHAMPYNIDPSALVNLPCPRCGEKTAETVATIQTSPHLLCSVCGAMFSVNAEKVMEKLRAVEEQAQLERRRRGI